MLSYTEENYLKALLHLAIANPAGVGTNDLAGVLEVKPATVSDMLRKLREKKLIHYKKYGKITLTETGKLCASDIVRKHRLWETFLHEKLDFGWEEVHELAEQLEHIQSDLLIDKLDRYLGHPQFDPHGDPIPSPNGSLRDPFRKSLADVQAGIPCRVAAVRDNSNDFLNYVNQVGLRLNDSVLIESRNAYDRLITLVHAGDKRTTVGEKFAGNVLVVCADCPGGKACPASECDLLKKHS